MKPLITILLTAAIILLPVQRPKAQLAPAMFCIAIVAVVVAGGVAVYVTACKPKYFCVRDKDSGAQWCRITTRRNAELEGWKVIAGPFSDAAECDKRCSDTNQPTAMLSIASTDFIIIEKSTDLKNWLVAGVVPGTPEDFEYAETNSLTAKACFYRARF